MKAREYMMVCPTAIVPLICNVCSKVMAIPHMKGRLPNRGLNRENITISGNTHLVSNIAMVLLPSSTLCPQ